MMSNYCGHCGASIRGGTKFCRQCGMEIDPDSPPAGTLPDASDQLRRSVPSFSAVVDSSAVRVPHSETPPDQAAAEPALLDVETIEKAEGNRRHLRLVRASEPRGEDPEPPPGSARSPVVAPPVERQARTADALAAASGLINASPASARIRYLMIASAVILVGVAALGYYRQSLPLLQADARERNLITPEEQSQQEIRLGEQDEQRGDYESAIAHYRQALALTPRSTTALLHMARSQRAIGRIDEALKICAMLLRESPQHLDAHWLMADLYYLRGNWRDAYHEYQRIIAIDSQSGQAIAALAMIEAYQARQAGRLPVRRSVPHPFEIQPPVGPELPPVADANAPLAVAEPGAAAVAAPPAFWANSPESAAEQRRSLVAAYKEQGDRYLKIREYIAAIVAYKNAVRLVPDESDFHYMIAMCYMALGQKELAHESYLKCTSGPYAQTAANAAKKLEKELSKEMARNKSALPASTPAEIRLPSRPTIHSVDKKP